MEIKVSHGAYVVHVKAGELVCGSGKPLPYATIIGTIDARGKINVWTPAASVPRGYKDAAKAALLHQKSLLVSSGMIRGR